MILGLDLYAWLKILAISAIIFTPIWVIGEMVAGRLTVEFERIDMEEKDGSTKDKNGTPK